MLHCTRVKSLICLCTKSTDRRTFTSIEHFHLNVSLVNVFTHFTTESVNFANNNPFGRPPNCRVTRHKGQHFQINCCQHRFTTHTSRSQTSFNTSMPSTNNNYIIIFSKFVCHFISPYSYLQNV